MSSDQEREELQKALALRIQAGERELLPELWETVTGLVTRMAQRVLLALGNNNTVEFNDLYNSGWLALCAAVERYKPEECSFSTWFVPHLKTAFAEATGYRTKRGRLAPLRNAVSLSTPTGEDENGATLGDMIADPAAAASVENVENSVWLEQLRAAIDEAVQSLTQDEKETLQGRYWQNMTFSEIAEKRGVWPATAQQWEKKALRRLKRLRGRELAHFYSFDYRRSAGFAAFQNTGMSIQEQYLVRWENIVERRERDRATETPRFNAQNRAENGETASTDVD